MNTRLIAFAFGILTSLNTLAQITAPDVLVRTTAEEVIELIRQDPEIRNGNTERVVRFTEEMVLPHFDFVRMTQLAMGRKWRQATPDQRAALVPEFRTLLVRTYSSALIQYVDQKLEYLPLKAKPEDTQVVVHTLVKQSSGGAPVQIDYRMIKNDKGWKVFDVMVAGVSLVVTYRSSFDEIITNSGVDGLIKELRTKNQNGTT